MRAEDVLARVGCAPYRLARGAIDRLRLRTGAYSRRIASDLRPMVLAYHGVVPAEVDPVVDRFCVTVDVFEEQLMRLGAVVKFVGLRELLAGHRGGRPAALVTFDDGFGSVYEHARPILRRLGIPALVSVTAGLLGSARSVWSLEIDLIFRRGRVEHLEIPDHRGRRYRYGLSEMATREAGRRFARAMAWAGGGDFPIRLVEDLVAQVGVAEFARCMREFDHLRMLTVEELRGLTRDGFDVGVHGLRHLGLGSLDGTLLDDEIDGARRALAVVLGGTPLDAFCLPFGEASPEALDQVRRRGFRACLTSTPGRVVDSWLLPRFDGAVPVARLFGDVARETRAASALAR